MENVVALVYTRKEAAELAKVSVPIIDRWIRFGGLPVIRIGRMYRIPARLFAEWLDRQAKAEAGEA